MYIWQWRTCAFKHHFLKRIAFLSLSWVHRPYCEKNEEKNKRTTSKRRMATILSTESNTNSAFGGQLTQRTDTREKNKNDTTTKIQLSTMWKWNMTLDNVQHNVNYFTSFTAQMPAQTISLEGRKRRRGIKRWTHKMMLLWSTSQAASSSSWYHSSGAIISRKAHQKSI